MILNPESTFDDVTRLSNSKLELRDFALTKTSDDKIEQIKTAIH